MERGKLRQDALQLSVKLVCLYDVIDKKAFLKNQLARAGTSIGANIHEADYAESPTDFIHKLKIALKECHETEYWLHVLAATCPELAEQAKELRREAGSIRRMLISSIRTCQNNIEAKAYKV
ncbi:MAG: four helix bundle protein [Akkermansiaceae bacterium]|nr:four helix bundle protein [Akkermansiaceae bacterium]